MKEIKKEITKYVCSICNKEYHYNFQATGCEEQHNCKHENFYFEFEKPEYWAYIGINKHCSQCDKLIEFIRFEDIEDSKLEDVFNILK